MPSAHLAQRTTPSSDPLVGLRHDMMIWAEPVIADRIWEAYRDYKDVMEELMDIVFKRFRSSREVAKGFSLVLLAAASTIGAARPLAA